MLRRSGTFSYIAKKLVQRRSSKIPTEREI